MPHAFNLDSHYSDVLAVQLRAREPAATAFPPTRAAGVDRDRREPIGGVRHFDGVMAFLHRV